MATHSSILAWEIPRTGEPGWAIVHGVAKCRTWLTHIHTHTQSKKAQSSFLNHSVQKLKEGRWPSRGVDDRSPREASGSAGLAAARGAQSLARQQWPAGPRDPRQGIS